MSDQKSVEINADDLAKDDNVKRVAIHGLIYMVSEYELDFLNKLPEEDRLFALCSLRYEHVVLANKKISPFEKSKIRQAIRFAAEFVKHGISNK